MCAVHTASFVWKSHYSREITICDTERNIAAKNTQILKKLTPVLHYNAVGNAHSLLFINLKHR